MNSGILTKCGLLSVGLVLAGQTPSEAQVGSNDPVLVPLTAPAQTTNVVGLSLAEQLGKDLFFDQTLSNPEGYSCATCHLPQSGFTGPSSELNLAAGPVPGVVAGRFGRRKPQTIPYTAFSPEGPYLTGGEGGTYVGGTFWDGRTPDTAAQAAMPFLDQNEMANTPTGPFPPHAGGYSPLVAEKLQNAPYAALFQTVFGSNVFQASADEQIYSLLTSAIATYEASAEVNQFSSKFDASIYGTPPLNLYQFSPSEQAGRALFFGAAQCSQCHSDAGLPFVMNATHGKETFTMYCYANIGVPANPGNPFYLNTNCDSNPEGCNSLGTNFVDYGLGANPNPAPDGTVFYTNAPGDLPQFEGLMKAPSLRNVDLRPDPSFVKSYMHNGVFKSLQQVVHFYNKRNIATNAAGVEMAFNLATGPPDGYTPVFPPPEVLLNVQNIDGLTPGQAAELPPPPDGDGSHGIDFNGQVGNLQLTGEQETNLVDFLMTLTDGYTSPNSVNVAGLTSSLNAVSVQPDAGTFVMQYSGLIGQFVVQTSTDLANWSSVSTNLSYGSPLNLTNPLVPATTRQFWRVTTVPQ